MKDDLVSLSDFVWQRTSRRLDGMGEDEYLWEPVPGCWTVRDLGGSYQADGVHPPPQPPPFTTMAWRLVHLTRCYGADRNGRFLHVELEPVLTGPAGGEPATAQEALERLGRAHARWRRHLEKVPRQAMAEKLGPVAGPFAEGTLAGFVLHMLDEFVHHGAELGVLRDLYRATTAATSTADDLLALATDGAGRGQAVRDNPFAVVAAAAAGRWDVVVALTEAGFGLGAADGRTPLHLAAGAGALPAVRALLAHGADVNAVDPTFGATPQGWAEYFGSADVAALLATS